MRSDILISAAYLPPVEYFSILSCAGKVLIEREENYVKQSYRNRCYILSSHGTQILTVPVYMGSIHKTPIKDIRIDYSKRWQQVHLGALTAAYNSSPYFQFYFEEFERIIAHKNEFLLDLNTHLLELVLKMLGMELSVSYTEKFEPLEGKENDFRYGLSPKKVPLVSQNEYPQVFNSSGFTGRLSIVDLIFNTGPDAISYLI
jgi:hypothetical protein